MIEHSGQTQHLVNVALATAMEGAIDATDRAEMLMEIAIGLQVRPESEDQLLQAIALYEQAMQLAHQDQSSLLEARIRARMGTALMALPSAESATIERAVACFEASRTGGAWAGQR